MISERAQYTANTGMVVISTANTNRNGSGTLGSVITGASNGTLIKTVTIKSNETAGTTAGMVRLFVYYNDGMGHTETRLLREIKIPATTRTGINPTFSITVDLNFILLSGEILKASTEIGEDFVVVADGLDWTY